MVLDHVAEAPSISTRQLAHEMHGSKDTVWRLLRQHQLHPYHLLWTACLVWWLARLPAIQDVLDLIPGYTLEIFLEV